MKERDDDTEATAPAKKAKKNTSLPTTKAREVLQFLEAQHWGARGDDGSPMNSVDKIVLAAGYGPAARRLGPTVREWTFAPKQHPGREALVELANEILMLAEQDCDALRKQTTYVVAAYDLARGDRAVGRVLLRVAPSDTRSVLEEERYALGGDDEEGGLSTKLLLGLLDSERRDKRWMFEQVMHVLSGVSERDAQRIERMEQIVDGAFAKQVSLLEATEEMLSTGADRKAKLEWAAWKQAKLGHVVDKLLGAAELFVPAALAKLPAVPSPAAPAGVQEALRAFMEGATEEQLSKAFGDWEDGGTKKCLRAGIMSPEQTLVVLAVTTGEAPVSELAKLTNGALQVSSEQYLALTGIFSREQLQPLQAALMTARGGGGQ